jgi:di/tricarboxylate transporter
MSTRRLQVVLPVALQTLHLGLNPRTFAIMIALHGTRITHQATTLIIYGLGRYRFMDFLKVGSC